MTKPTRTTEMATLLFRTAHPTDADLIGPSHLTLVTRQLGDLKEALTQAEDPSKVHAVNLGITFWNPQRHAMAEMRGLQPPKVMLNLDQIRDLHGVLGAILQQADGGLEGVPLPTSEDILVADGAVADGDPDHLAEVTLDRALVIENELRAFAKRPLLESEEEIGAFRESFERYARASQAPEPGLEPGAGPESEAP